MDTENMKEYLLQLYEVESSIYCQEGLLNELKQEIRKIEKWRPYDYAEYINSNLRDCHEADLALVLGMPGMILGGILGWKLKSTIIGIIIGILVGTILASIIMEIILSIADFFYNGNVRKRNRWIDKENKRIMEDNERRLPLLKATMEQQEDIYNQTITVRDKLYSLEIIYPKYRNLIAISSFCEYFCSERCSSLKGYEGAYNIYEDERRQDMIIEKLDDVIANLKAIKHTQYMLYTAIENSNKILQDLSGAVFEMADNMESLSDNMAINAYNNSIIARNTEYLKNIEAIETYNFFKNL